MTDELSLLITIAKTAQKVIDFESVIVSTVRSCGMISPKHEAQVISKLRNLRSAVHAYDRRKEVI